MKTYQDVFTGEGRLDGDLHLVTYDTVTSQVTVPEVAHVSKGKCQK